jgi:hypothetical protein
VRNCSIGNSARAVDPAPERGCSAMGFEEDQPLRVSDKLLLLIIWHIIIYSYYIFLHELGWMVVFL